EIHHEARQRKRFGTLQTVLAPHELEHRVDRERRRLVEILVEAEREPRIRRPSDRRRELEIVSKRQAELDTVERALDRDLRHLAAPLPSVTVAGREERAVERHGQVEPGSLHELLAVDVPAENTRRPRGVDARLRRRHPEDTEERVQVELLPTLAAADRTA